MEWKKIVEDFSRYALIILLAFNVYGSVFISLSDLNTYFFGKKLTGLNAIIYLTITDIAASVIIYLLFMKKSNGEILSLIYFGYSSMESLMTNLSLGFGYSVIPLYKSGLIISIILLITRKMIYS